MKIVEEAFSHIDWKLWRVRTHTEEISRLATEFLESDFYQLIPTMDDEGRFVLRFGKVEPMPQMISLLIGEAAHHLRSALDHLIFSFAKPTNEREERSTQFPIFDTAEKFQKSSWSLMPGVCSEVVELIESIQPYHFEKLPEAASLQQLRDLNNWEKHRLPLLTITTFSMADFNISIVDGAGQIIDQELFKGRVEPDVIVAQFSPVGHWTAGTSVYPHPHFQLFPVFDGSMPECIAGHNPLDVLSGAGEFIQYNLLPRFKRFA